MNNHYIIVADHGHLRIYEQRMNLGQRTPGLTEVQSLDFPHGRASYTARDTDQAGRFQSSAHQSRGPGAPTSRTGMSVDERLPMQREVDRRANDDIAESIQKFLAGTPDATWDFAAGVEVHNRVLEQLSPAVRTRLRKSVSKDIVNQPASQLLTHFHA